MSTQKTFPTSDMALTTIMVVSDIEKSKEFYLTVLGGKLYREYGGNSVVLQFLGHWLLLVTGGGPTGDKPETHFRPPVDPDSVSHAFTIRVSDCGQAYNVLRSRGAEFITPPYERETEIRCFFRDPDGHLFEISEVR